MDSPFRAVIWIGVVCVVLMAVLYLVFNHYSSPGWEAERAEKHRAREQEEQFIARFDSLYHARLLPTAWKLGVFTRTRFDGEFTEWTLTIGATDWYNRSTASKNDVVATLWACYRGVREQAGGDPDQGRLIIEDNDGNKVAECSADGTRILR
jgi:hypothetical protein